MAAWHRYVLSEQVAAQVDGRYVLLGDHTHVVKDGGRMPGVVSLRETSETQQKPSYFRGQCWGALGLIVGRVEACFCLPLELRLHQGFIHRGEPPPEKPACGSTLGERVVEMALTFAHQHGLLTWLVLDAFFASAKVFQIVRSLWRLSDQQPYVHVLVRAKKNYVGYYPAAAKPPDRPGAQATYGDKLHLYECFDHPHLFESIKCEVYGHTETVQVMSENLLWRPLGDYVRFIWVVTSRGALVLMSSDLTLSPATAIELYCLRTRIEIMFAVLKTVLKAFCFHFWTKALPRHPRRPRANRHLQPPPENRIHTVQACWNSYERFVLCALIAQGLLQLIALQFRSTIWQQHTLYLRTYSRSLPSERTVRQVLATHIVQQFVVLPQNSILRKLQAGFDALDDDEEEPPLKNP